MKNFAILLITFIFLQPDWVLGQYEKQWELYKSTNSIGRPSFSLNSDNHLKTVIQSDGSFVTLGSKQKNVGEFGDEIYVFSYSSDGNTLWDYVYQGNHEINEYPYDISVDENDNIFIVGRTATYYFEDFETKIEFSKCLVIKLNSDGELIWEKEFEGPSDSFDYCSSIEISDDSEIYALSRIDGICFLVKMDSQGEELWSTPINSDIPFTLQRYGEQIICVTKNSNANNPSYIYSLDSNGSKLDSFYLTNLRFKWPKFDSQKNIYKLQPNGDFEIEKRNSTGDLEWIYMKDSNLPPNVYADELQDCTFDEFGNVYVTGRYYGLHYGDSLLYSNCDILTSKIDKNGNVLWENIYKHDNTPSSCQIGEAVKLRFDGSVFVLGDQSVEVDGDVFASRDMAILQYNQSGERTDSIYFNSVYGKKDFAINIEFIENDIYVFGYSENLESIYEMVIIKYSPKASSTMEAQQKEILHVFPNPTNKFLNFSIKDLNVDIELWDINGNLVHQITNHITINGIEIPSYLKNGLYILIVKNGDVLDRIKFVKYNH